MTDMDGHQNDFRRMGFRMSLRCVRARVHACMHACNMCTDACTKIAGVISMIAIKAHVYPEMKQ